MIPVIRIYLLYLRTVLIIEKRQKGRKSEKKTANVQMPRTVGVLFGLSILFAIIT